jgi:hypothetical protein
VRLQVTDGQQLVHEKAWKSVTHQMQHNGRRPSIAPAPDEIDVDGILDKTEHGNDVRVLETLEDTHLGIEVLVGRREGAQAGGRRAPWLGW